MVFVNLRTKFWHNPLISTFIFPNAEVVIEVISGKNYFTELVIDL